MLQPRTTNGFETNDRKTEKKKRKIPTRNRSGNKNNQWKLVIIEKYRD